LKLHHFFLSVWCFSTAKLISNRSYPFIYSIHLFLCFVSHINLKRLAMEKAGFLQRGLVILMVIIMISSCQTRRGGRLAIIAPQWEEITLQLVSAKDYENPYTDVDVYAIFKHPMYGELRRPAFWDGGYIWNIRFASPVAQGEWTWETFCSNPADDGLHGFSGTVKAVAGTGSNQLLRHGFLSMSEGKRNVVHADGTTFLVVADTPWALPWRATTDDVLHYAEDRMAKGFNAALLMTFCPDRKAQGPDARATNEGFARAFYDIESGHINQPIIPYFQYLDSIVSILIAHEIVPVYQPVFHGYGWKGLDVLGWNMQADEYARYCRYLVARYGARPAMWLVAGDADARNPGVIEGGMEIAKWDAYQQPSGLHYSPFDDYTPDWWNRDYPYEPHLNRVHQEQDWVHFQWAQTGHGGEHLFHKVERMYDILPVKASANGEPTYEGIRESENGSGWWQGHDAWGQLMHGGTMGVVYGAGGLWNWKITPDEEGWPQWANSNVSWKQALELPGSVYVGYVGKALKEFDLTDIERHRRSDANGFYLKKPGKTWVVYLENGGTIMLDHLTGNMPFEWFNPQAGQIAQRGTIAGTSQVFEAPGNQPWVLIIGWRNINTPMFVVR
jgi:hypothetical protein